MKHIDKTVTVSTAAEDIDIWRDSALASRVAEAEAPVLKTLCADLFGYQLLQIGYQSDLVAGLDECAIRSKILVSPSADLLTTRSMVAKADALPILSDSVDVAVMPHTLDFSTDPRQALREVERVLIPEGRVIICGFNPRSLWGARRALRRMRNRQPWKAHFISTHRLQDWLSLLGFDVEQIEMRMFRPPLLRSTPMRSLQGLESLGQRFWPWAGATYVIRAVKRVSTVTPVRPHWRLEQSLGKRAVEPATNTGYRNIIPIEKTSKTK